MITRVLARNVLRRAPFHPSIAASNSLRPFSSSLISHKTFDSKNNRQSGVSSLIQQKEKTPVVPPSETAKAPKQTGGELPVSESQPEFDTAANPKQNTNPSPGAGPGRTRRETAGAKSAQDFQNPEPDHNKSQDEFTSSEPPETSETAQRPAGSKPLPDLRQGIPSTFAEEFMQQAEDKSRQSRQDEDAAADDTNREGAGPEGSGSGRAPPKSAYQTSTDRRRNKYFSWGTLATAIVGVSGAVYYGRDWDTIEEERAHQEAPNGWNLNSFWARINARWSGQIAYYTEPAFPKLLPTMDPAPPYTLVLSLEDLLVHSEWTRENGWRTAKRPGLDYFLRYLCQYYEIVVFTSLPSTAADPIIRALDPIRLTIMWPLFREATRYENGEYVKDLSYLNRDLSKTILVDTKPVHAKLQPENAIILPAWKGGAKDQGLVGLIPFLEYLAAMGIPDVRKAIQSFEGKDIPTEFARREAVAREKFNKQLAEENAKKPKHGGASWIAGALGLKPQGGLQLEEGQSVAEGLAQGKMLSDLARERGQKQYEALEKEVRENYQKWLAELQAEEKKAQEEGMKAMKDKVTFGSIFSGSGKKE